MKLVIIILFSLIPLVTLCQVVRLKVCMDAGKRSGFDHNPSQRLLCSLCNPEIYIFITCFVSPSEDTCQHLGTLDPLEKVLVLEEQVYSLGNFRCSSLIVVSYSEGGYEAHIEGLHYHKFVVVSLRLLSLPFCIFHLHDQDTLHLDIYENVSPIPSTWKGRWDLVILFIGKVKQGNNCSSLGRGYKYLGKG